MPDRQTLEEYLEGSSKTPNVIFDHEKGEFVWTVKRPKK